MCEFVFGYVCVCLCVQLWGWFRVTQRATSHSGGPIVTLTQISARVNQLRASSAFPGLLLIHALTLKVLRLPVFPFLASPIVVVGPNHPW